MHSRGSVSSVGLWHTLFWGAGAYILGVATQLIAITILAAASVGASGDAHLRRPWAQIEAMANDPVFAARAMALSFLVSAPLLWIFMRVATGTVRDRNTYLGLDRAPVRSFGVALVLVATFFLVSIGFDAYFERPSIHASTQAVYEASLGFWIFPVLGSLVLLGPFFEELLYRGFLLPGFSQSALGPYGASVLVAALFAGSHFQYDRSDLLQVFVLGVALCGLRIRYHSIWPPLFLHALNNLGAWLYGWYCCANVPS